MIFGSFGLLVVALALLIAAVVKSSVAIGVASLVCTGLAVGCLVAANAYYRKRADDRTLGADDTRRPLTAEAPAPPALVMVPQMAMANGGYANGHNPAATAPDGLPVENFEHLDAAHAVAAVDMLNLDQLHQLRRYEIEHEARKSVLAAIDARVTGIVKLRRSLEA
ncbi:MAG: hypothetical protein NVSMB12_09850 [Acidimicrobiales bacterium]